MQKIQKIILSTVPVIIGAVAGIATATGIGSWYRALEKPVFNPPNSLFGPVWTALYILMGVGLYSILSAAPSVERTKALRIFWIQLGLNSIWSFIFFTFHELAWSFLEILLIWGAIVWMIVAFYKVNKTAALLQIPYLMWVSFASVLNGTIWYLN